MVSVLIVIVNVLRTGDNAKTNPGTNKSLVHSTRYKKIQIDKGNIDRKMYYHDVFADIHFQFTVPFLESSLFCIQEKLKNGYIFSVVDILLCFVALMFYFILRI